MTAHLLYTLWLSLHTKKRDFPQTENHHHGKILNSAFFSRSEKIEDEAFILFQLISGCREAGGYYQERHYHRRKHSPRYDVPRDQVFISTCRQAEGESLGPRIRQKRHRRAGAAEGVIPRKGITKGIHRKDISQGTTYLGIKCLSLPAGRQIGWRGDCWDQRRRHNHE